MRYPIGRRPIGGSRPASAGGIVGAMSPYLASVALVVLTALCALLLDRYVAGCGKL